MNVYELNEYNPNTRSLFEIAEQLKKGGTIIFPTDTNYALGCIMSNKAGIDKIIKISGKREKQSKLSLICNDLKVVADYTLPYSNHIFKTMKRYLPGPYTFILKANTAVTRFFKNNKREIGIRIPDNLILLKLLEELDTPLISTSLNIKDSFGKHQTNPNEIFDLYQHRVDVLIDGGLGSDNESTVLDCTDNNIVILRQGIGEVD